MQKNNSLTLIGDPWTDEVISKTGRTYQIKYANFLCDCGNIKKLIYDKWKSGWTKSCGCVSKQKAREQILRIRADKIHNLTDHPLYYKWCHIKEKCNYPNAVGYYGGQIKMLPLWNDNFKEFYEWAINNGWKKDLFLNRKDLTKGFDPNNCYFSDKKLTRNNVLKGQETCLQKYGTPIINQSNSNEENTLRDWINTELQLTTTKDYKILNGKEIDIYCDQAKIGIEYCGIFWHSEKRSGTRLGHYNKYQAAKNKGVHLLHIFSDEWLYKTKQVKNFLRSMFGKSYNRVFARKCVVQPIDKKIAKSFLDENHIQGGTVRSSYCVGLYHEELLLGVMTFAKHQRNNDTTCIILERFAILDDYSVVGGASKMLSFATNWCKKEGYTRIISWSDNRWSTGNVYEKMGFKLDAELKPDYSYVKGTNSSIRYSKQSMKKSSTGCPKDVTEKDWCIQNNYYRIWDCGKKRFVLYL